MGRTLVAAMAIAGGILPLAAMRQSMPDQTQLRATCGTCHALPPPDVLPKSAWPAEVVRMEGQVLQIRELREQVSVGYGATRQASAPMRLATVDVGYADGYPRVLGNCGFAVWAGHRAPVIGRVSMDLLTVELSGAPHAGLVVGDYLELLGGGAPLEEVAALAGTINYELLTSLSRRAHRIYL